MEQNRDQEYEELLKDLSSQMPFTSKIGGKSIGRDSDSETLARILDYKDMMCQVIDNIQFPKIFRIIQLDLPEDYVSEMQINQIQRLMKLKQELENTVPNIRDIQSTLKKFISDLDIKEAYQFAILNPFLINEDELQKHLNDVDSDEESEDSDMKTSKLDLNNELSSSSSSEEDNYNAQGEKQYLVNPKSIDFIRKTTKNQNSKKNLTKINLEKIAQANGSFESGRMNLEGNDFEDLRRFKGDNIDLKDLLQNMNFTGSK